MWPLTRVAEFRDSGHAGPTKGSKVPLLAGMAGRKKKRPKRAKPDGGSPTRATQETPKTSAEKLVEQADGLEALALIAPILRLFGSRGREAAGALSEARGLAGQARELKSLPGRFNVALGPRGWIAYERMNHELLRQATELAEAGEFEAAEALLVDALAVPGHEVGDHTGTGDSENPQAQWRCLTSSRPGGSRVPP